MEDLFKNKYRISSNRMREWDYAGNGHYLNPLWQSNYYDHVIRDSDEYRKISDYIIANPKNWSNDMFSKH